MKTSTKTVSTAKSRNGSTLFIFTLALLVFLSGALPVGAHEAEGHIEGYNVEEHDYTTTASDVDITDRQSVYNFLLHLRAHFEDAPDLNVFSVLRVWASEEGGDWRDGTTYLIRVDDRGGVAYHAYHPLAQNGNLSGSKAVRDLIEIANENEEGGCVPYVLGGEEKWACAAEFKSVGTVDGSSTVWIVGYHHDFEEVSFSGDTCPHYVPAVSATDVADTETLKQFVEGFKQYFLELRERTGISGIIQKRHCWRVLPWKHGSIYLFLRAHPSNRAIFNGISPELENQILYPEDENGCNSADEINRVLADEERECKDLGYLSEEDKKDNFFEYLWDDPTRDDDDIDIDTECPDGPRTCAPGRSPKVGYVAEIPLATGQGTLIMGSGFYPEAEGNQGDDDGCAIAGSGSGVKGAVFNLILVLSVLFSAVLWRKNRS